MNAEGGDEQQSVEGDGGLDDFGSPVELLGGWERALAVSIGIASGVAGGYAVFATSNQAGTAVLLIVSVVFLLIGIQGTPLVRFASGSSSVELERRKRVKRALKQAIEEDNVDKAVGIVEGIAIAEPHLVQTGILYKSRLTSAIMSLGYGVESSSQDSNFDTKVWRDDKMIFVETKYYREGASTVYNAFVSHLLMKIGPPDDRRRYGRQVLLVSNVPPSRISRELIARESEVITSVTWRDESDDDRLRDALADAFAKTMK